MGSLACHLDQAQLRNLGDIALDPIRLLALLEHSQHLSLMLVIDHIDKINNHDTANVTQAQLSGNCSGSFKIRPVNRFFQILTTDKSTGIDVNRGHRLGLINDQIAARLERHIAVKSGFYLIIKLVLIKQHSITRC